MNTKHTPGPWRYDFEQGYCGELIAANGVVVATFVDEPSEDDARLIAATPEMLEALNGLLSEAHGTSKGLHYSSEWSIKARAAIAKAIGSPAC